MTTRRAIHRAGAALLSRSDEVMTRGAFHRAGAALLSCFSDAMMTRGATHRASASMRRRGGGLASS
jgi:hypothetical protein